MPDVCHSASSFRKVSQPLEEDDGDLNQEVEAHAYIKCLKREHRTATAVRPSHVLGSGKDAVKMTPQLTPLVLVASLPCVSARRSL